MAALQGNPINFLRQWPNDAALTLIRARREFQPLFATSSREQQRGYWAQISQLVNLAHPNYLVITTKLNTLKLVLKANLHLNF
jgi:hypothetical protein